MKSFKIRREKRRFRPLTAWYVEQDEYLALLNRTNAVPDFIAQFSGYCQTDLGLGQLVEKIKDDNSGQISQSIAAAAKLYDMEGLCCTNRILEGFTA